MPRAFDSQIGDLFSQLLLCCCCYVASVVSDSVRSHRHHPTRVPRPWDSPGKNTGVGCHFLLWPLLQASASRRFGLLGDREMNLAQQQIYLRLQDVYIPWTDESSVLFFFFKRCWELAASGLEAFHARVCKIKIYVVFWFKMKEGSCLSSLKL